MKWLSLLIVLLSATALAASPQPVVPLPAEEVPGAAWGQPVDGLRLRLLPDRHEGAADTQGGFCAAFENVSDHGMLLYLGMMLANGDKMYPTCFRLLVSDEKGITRELTIDEPAVAGRIDDYVVSLRPRSTYMLTMRFDEFTDAKIWKRGLPPGRWSVVAVFESKGPYSEKLKILRFWKGRAESNACLFDLSPAGGEK